METKVCKECETEKPVESFSLAGRGQYRRTICKPCSVYLERERREKFKVDNPDEWFKRRRNTIIRGKYGITPEEYMVMYEAQAGCCKICRKPAEESRNGVLAVDHCHNSKDVRGLLCSVCNSGLGFFKDDPDLLAKAIDYLNEGLR